jgi:deoxyxylulose-5-phosphate synthase
MKEDERIVALTAAMPDGTGLSKVMKEFPIARSTPQSRNNTR